MGKNERKLETCLPKKKKKVGKFKIHIVFISTKIVKKKKFRIRKSANISIFLEKKVKE